MDDQLRSAALSRFRDARLCEIQEAIKRLDKSAALIEALALPDVAVYIVCRLAEKPMIFVSKDVTDLSEATELLRRLAKAGFHLLPSADPITGKKEVYSDYPEIGRREWSLTNDVKFALFVPTEGEGVRCFRRKVGSEVVDKYEIVCSQGA